MKRVSFPKSRPVSRRQRYKSLLDKKERPWGPYYVGVYDLGDIRDHRPLFVPFPASARASRFVSLAPAQVRKASRAVDPNIFRLLPVDDYAEIPDVRWPNDHEDGAHVGVSAPAPKFETVARGKDVGCIRVAESIHCPPVHTLKPDVAAAHAVASELAKRGAAPRVDVDEL